MSSSEKRKGPHKRSFFQAEGLLYNRQKTDRRVVGVVDRNFFPIGISYDANHTTGDVARILSRTSEAQVLGIITSANCKSEII